MTPARSGCVRFFEDAPFYFGFKGTPKGTRLVFLRGRGSPTKDERRAAPSERLADALSRGIVHVGIIYGLPLRPERKAGVAQRFVGVSLTRWTCVPKN